MTGDITTTPVYQGGGLTSTSAQALVNDGLGEYLKSCSGFITSFKKKTFIQFWIEKYLKRMIMGHFEMKWKIKIVSFGKTNSS